MGQSKTVFQLLKYAVWVVAIILLLDSIGINITVLVASSAALLVGLGFGIQGLFNDYISGLVVLFEGLIKVGDVVEIESELIGRVMDVNLRTSKILTRDNIIMIIPNHNFVSDNVINWSYNEPRTRFYVDVGVAYGSDVRLVEKLLIESADEQTEVISNPKAFVLFRDFGNSSLDFRLYFWVEEVFYVELLKSRIRFSIDEKFRANKVQIPFPQRDLHLKSGWENIGGGR
jgi:small-conductance mechanosensitive channel